jgi:multiple sugar transport system substrate-binding protein
MSRSSDRTTHRRRQVRGAATLGAMALALSACGGSSGSTASTATSTTAAAAASTAAATTAAASSAASTAAGSTAAASATTASSPAATNAASTSVSAELSKPQTITYWTWVSGIDKEVALFEKKYPNIHVNLVNAGQGSAEYTKLRTALKAGSGAPDVVQLEGSELPSFLITNDLLDLAPYGASAIAGDFVDWTWKQVSVGTKVYAIPQDTGPMGLVYRADLFTKYGIAVPTTWAEFATAAQKLHAADPKVYLTNFPPNDVAPLFGLGWQAGARPFASSSSSSVTVALADPGMTKVANFWTPLLKSKVISTDPDFTDQWYQGLASGKYASWITAAWGPLFLSGSAKGTSGKWRVAPLPQWTAGGNAAGNWGGSVNAVTKKTANPAAAAALAEFINSDPASTKLLATTQFLYPATKALLSDPTFTGQKSAFYGGQQVNEVFAQISPGISTDFQWSPFQDFVSSSANDTIAKNIAAGSDLATGLQSWQSTVVSYAKKQGFTVATQ